MKLSLVLVQATMVRYILIGSMTKFVEYQSLPRFSQCLGPISTLLLTICVAMAGCTTMPSDSVDRSTNQPNDTETIEASQIVEDDSETFAADPPTPPNEPTASEPTIEQISLSGVIYRGDNRTVASRRPITFEVQDTNGVSIDTFRTTNGRYDYLVPIGFTGSIRPTATDVDFDPVSRSFEHIQSNTTNAFNAYLTFHVDKDGVGGKVGMSHSIGTAEFPLASIQTAADQALPGDTILVRAGTYTSHASDRFEVVPVLEITRGGLDGSPITIKSYENESVTLDAQHKHNECIRIQNQSHIRIEGLIAARSKGRNVRIENSQHIEIINCVARDNLLGNLPGFLLQGRCRYCIFDRCVSTRNGRGFLLSGSVETDDPSQDHRPRFCTIRNCLAYENTRDAEDSDGFQMLASSDNAIIRCVAHDNGDDGFDLTRGSHRNVLVGCTAYNHPAERNGDGDGNGFKIGVWGQAPTDSDGGGVDNVISRCIAFDNKYGLNNNAIRLRILNNVFYGNERFGIVFDESTIATCGQSPPCRGEAILRNNIVSDNVGSDFLFNRARSNPIMDSDNNYIGDDTSTNDHTDESGHEESSLFGRNVGEPGFADPSIDTTITDIRSPDFGRVPGFELIPTSPILNRGQRISMNLIGPISPDHPLYSNVIDFITSGFPSTSNQTLTNNLTRADLGVYVRRP